VNDDVKAANDSSWFFIHGFLGLPQDWNEILRETGLTENLPNPTLVNLWRDSDLNPKVCSLSRWGQAFTEKYLSKLGDSGARGVGYSLGGRLLLHAFAHAPERFSKVVLIAAHPGIRNEVEKIGRLKNETYWSEKFLSSPWDSTLREWNSQSVFANSQMEPLRLESDFDRSQLARSLTDWSLGHQQDFSDLIQKYADKIIYICGDCDAKFVGVANHIRSLGVKNIHIIPQASHRVHFEQARAVAEILNSIIHPAKG
jgi:2-succinyl-6-hydroxy-2,4-cyclohexadiene-1-carboxylate synthase